MTPLYSEIPESFSGVIARLRDVVRFLQRAAARHPAEGTPPSESAAAELAFDPDQDDAVSMATLDEGLPTCAQALRACGQVPWALLVEACAAALKRMHAVPALHSPDAQAVVARALEAVLAQADRPVQDALAAASDLFPLYRAVQHLAGADRVHPADLWPARSMAVELPADPFTRPRAVDAAAREAMEAALLALMRQPQAQDFQRMSELCAELGEGASGLPSSLWKLASAVYEAQADQLLSPDVYLKRLGPRLLALTRPVTASSAAGTEAPLAGAGAMSEPMRLLGHELLFFCHRAVAAAAAAGAPAPGPRLQRFAMAYALAWGLSPEPHADSGDEAGLDPKDESAGERIEERPNRSGHEGHSGEPLPAFGEGSLVSAIDAPAQAPGTPAPRTLADAVPGLPSAADLDLSGWGLAANADQAALPGDEVKVIGPLRLEIPAFNAFLNDADEASRRLATSIAEWAVEPSQALPREAFDQARALAQGAERVGHAPLAVMADLLARVLDQGRSRSAPDQPSTTLQAAADVLHAAAEEIRRVLHQFAAGFMTEPSSAGLEALQACLAGDDAPGPGGHALADHPAHPDVLLPRLQPSQTGQALQAVADLHAGVQEALDRLAHCRPSMLLESAGLSAHDPHVQAALVEADRWFDGAWADATSSLAACEQQIQAMRTESGLQDASPEP